MAANKILRFGPVALTTTLTTNILNPPTLTGGVGVPGTTVNTYFIIRHIRIVNKTTSAASFSLWLGATGANAPGTEIGGIGTVIPPNSAIDLPFANLTLDIADFLVGGSATATALTLTAEGEIGIR